MSVQTPPARTTAPAAAAPFVPGGGASVPPASVPLGFLAAAGVGLTALGLAVWFAADRIVSAPTHPGAASAVHVGVLAFLTTAVLGWLGLTYVSVAEKLWPMFLLAHRPRVRAGAWAVGLLATGVPVLASGLPFGAPWLAWPGGVTVAAGLTCHLASLASVVRHRRRPLELLHTYLFASVLFLVAAAVLGAAAALASVEPLERARLVAAELAALVGWLGLAVIGHAHKIVPFIAYTSLRARGVTTGPGGRPLLFGDLFHRGAARLTFASATAGFVAVVGGIAAASAATVAAGAVAIAAAGALVTANLATGPRRAARAGGAQVPRRTT